MHPASGGTVIQCCLIGLSYIDHSIDQYRFACENGLRRIFEFCIYWCGKMSQAFVQLQDRSTSVFFFLLSFLFIHFICFLSHYSKNSQYQCKYLYFDTIRNGQGLSLLVSVQVVNLAYMERPVTHKKDGRMGVPSRRGVHGLYTPSGWCRCSMIGWRVPASYAGHTNDLWFCLTAILPVADSFYK